MHNFIDLEGQQIDEWTILGVPALEDEQYQGKSRNWVGQCSCKRIKIISRQALRRQDKKHHCGCKSNNKSLNETFFHNIETPEQAYLLGFFVADGSLMPKENRISFSSKDKSQLNLVKRLLRSDHKIAKRIKKENDAIWYRISIKNRIMALELNKLGYDNKKSYNAIYPDIPNYLDSHFLRGVLDGDGCISRIKRKKGFTVHLTYCGTPLLLNEINNHLPHSLSTHIRHDGLAIYSCAGKKAFNILNWIYKDSIGLRLERKYHRYQEAINKTGFYAPIER